MPTVTLTQDEIRNGLLYSYKRPGQPDVRLGPGQYTYSIASGLSSWSHYSPGTQPFTNYAVLSSRQADAFRLAMSRWDALILPDFVEITETASSHGEIRVAFTEYVAGTNSPPYAYYPILQNQTSIGSDVWLPTASASQENAYDESFGFTTLLHEIGHALGLKHPHDAPILPSQYDNDRYTIMSYNSISPVLVQKIQASGQNSVSLTFDLVYVTTPMVLDIAAAQMMYGADPDTGAGNSTYIFTQGDLSVRAIYDASGDDTFDCSGFTRTCIIDLTPGSYSSIGFWTIAEQMAYWIAQFPNHKDFIEREFSNPQQALYVWADNVGIALSTTIENAVGGSANDTLIGNSAANRLDGGDGADTMSGGLGNDTYVVDNSGDAVSETAGGGIDMVLSSVSHILGQEVENLTLIGAVAINGTGNALDNILIGNGGSNVLDGGGGADQLAGGLGNDVYIIDASDTVTEAADAGTDEIRTALAVYSLGANLENLTGTAATGQALTGNSVANVITAGAGNDILDGGAGADQLIGGLGNDLYLVDAGDAVTEGSGAGTDEVRTALAAYALTANVENLLGTASTGQTLTGNGLANVIIAGTGNDTLDGGAGADQLIGGLGNDIYVVDANDTVTETADAGMDEIRTALAAYALAADFENLTGTAVTGQSLTGNGLANVIIAGSGNDILDGGAGADQLAGGLGNDTYLVDSGDMVFENPGGGTDEVRTALAAYALATDVETLTGTASTGQALTGNGLANIITAGAGNDILDGGTGADQLVGGLGNDLYFVDSGDTVSEAASAGTDEVRTALAAYTLATNVENLTGISATGQSLTGNGLANVIIAGGGNDILDGGAGADQLAGGLGNDTYVVDAGDMVFENPGGGTDHVRTALAAYALASDVENLTGTASTGQALTGNGLANVIIAGTGNDTLDGGAGADQLAGGLGNDLYWVDAGDMVFENPGGGTDEVRTALAAYALATDVETLTGTASTGQALTGNGLANVITAGVGNDILDGGAGADQLVGGLGNDLYIVDSGDTVTEGSSAGTDEVRTALAAYMLAANVENLMGISATGQALTGNGLANAIIAGAGNDTLDGGAGADQLAGGLGNDTYVVDAGDMVFENPGSGTDEVRTALAAYALASDVENLTGTASTGQALTGNGLANIITAGAGNDTLDGGAGADQLIGGLGNDLYLVDAGDTVVEVSGAGTDEVRTALAAYALTANVENLTGTSATGQTLTGNGLANVITGGVGNDTLDGGAGADQLRGGVGNDVYVIDASDTVTETADAGIDEVRTALAAYALGANIENLWGTSATGQALTGNGLANAIVGGSGNDTLDGGAGADQLAGGLGNDLYLVDAGDMVFENPNGGTDEVRTALAAYALASDVENLTGTVSTGQTLTGNGLANVITGGGGSDILDGGVGADTMRGGAGDDYYFVDNAGDVVVELSGQGLDTVYATLAAYSLLGTQIERLAAASDIAHEFRGSAGDNHVGGGGGNDVLLLQDGGSDRAVGGGGDDLLYFGAAFGGSDIADGGGGRDALVLQGNVTVVLGASNLIGIESLSLQSGANSKFGDTANNFYDFNITMADGNVLTGQQLIVNAQSLRAGEDFTFDGSAELDGKFLVYGGHGVDVLRGGAGNDIFFFEGQRWGSNDRIDGGAGRDSLVIAGAGGLNQITFGADSFTNIESISLNNLLASDPSQKPSYQLVLNNGNVAPGGTLIVNGSSIAAGQVANIDGRAVQGGALILFGGGGHDVLIGGAGADLIIGGAGSDSLTGGAGADTFRYDSTADATGTAPDLIGDFQTGLDRIDLSRIDANTTLAGDQAFTWIGASAFGGTAGQLRVRDEGGYRYLEGDTNGDGQADFAIAFYAVAAPQVQGDFVL